MNKNKKYHWGLLIGAVIVFFSTLSVNASDDYVRIELSTGVVSQFWVLLGSRLVLSALYTWSVGLTPPLIIRFLIVRRPIGKWWAIGTAVGFFFINTILFIILNKLIADAVGSQTHPQTTNPMATMLIAFVSYLILRKKLKHKPQ